MSLSRSARANTQVADAQGDITAVSRTNATGGRRAFFLKSRGYHPLRNLGSAAFPYSAGPAAIRAGDTSLNQQVKGILSFDTAELPDKATILSARVMLKRGVIYGNALTVLGRCIVDIKSGVGFGKATTLEPMDFQALAGKRRVAGLKPNR